MVAFIYGCKTVPYTDETLPGNIIRYENPSEDILVSTEFSLRPGKSLVPYSYLRNNMFNYGKIIGETTKNNAKFYVINYDEKYFFIDRESVDLYRKYKNNFMINAKWKEFTSNTRDNQHLLIYGIILESEDAECSYSYISTDLKYKQNIDDFSKLQQIQIDPQSIIITKSKAYQEYENDYPMNRIHICGGYSTKVKMQLETMGGFMKMFNVYKGKYFLVRYADYFLKFDMDKNL